METMSQWLECEYRYAAQSLLMSVSATGVVKTRPGFGQTVTPLKGSVVASPVPGAYDPDPDYFFHWFRDAALVIDALRVLYEDGTLGAEALTHFADHLRFNHVIESLDGRKLAASSGWRKEVAADFTRFLRDNAELAQVHDETLIADTRVNPDGTLDFSRWARPQHDGAALRALSLLRWLPHAPNAGAQPLLRKDLAFTFEHWHEPSFDIWEEDRGRNYYTLRVSAAALDEGARWLEGEGEAFLAQTYRDESLSILRELDDFWLADEGYYRSRQLGPGEHSPKELDISVLLSAIHAGTAQGAHSAQDPRMQATLARLEAAFDAHYPINHGRGADRGPALGRYVGDAYFNGGAWYLSTLGAAEFCFRAAAGAAEAGAWRSRGDAYLATVRAYTPPDGQLSEQFDPRSGAQLSAKHLAWSYAAFVSCCAARRALA